MVVIFLFLLGKGGWGGGKRSWFVFNDGYFTLRIRENATVEGNPTKIKTFFLFYLKKKSILFSPLLRLMQVSPLKSRVLVSDAWLPWFNILFSHGVDPGHHAMQLRVGENVSKCIVCNTCIQLNSVGELLQLSTWSYSGMIQWKWPSWLWNNLNW